MTALLVVVTFGALALAGALLFSVLRLTREERDRSAARSAALEGMIDLDESASGASGALVRAPMFGGAADALEDAPSRRLVAPAIGVLIVGLALTGIYVWNRPASAAAAQAAAPLELVSLRHQRQGDTLIVSGLVRNPHAGRSITGLAAVAFSFDRAGTFLSSGRAVLDFPQLAVGDESPFSISVPQSAVASRYRVSFRTEDGVVPHVDRRSGSATPSAEAQVTR